MKTGYKLLGRMQGIGRVEQNYSDKEGWKLIWLSKLPPRIKMLLWRAGNNILLISNILARHIISMPFSCCMCRDGDEINLRVALLLKFGTSWLSHLKSLELKETLSLNG